MGSPAKGVGRRILRRNQSVPFTFVEFGATSEVGQLVTG